MPREITVTWKYCLSLHWMLLFKETMYSPWKKSISSRKSFHFRKLSNIWGWGVGGGVQFSVCKSCSPLQKLQVSTFTLNIFYFSTLIYTFYFNTSTLIYTFYFNTYTHFISTLTLLCTYTLVFISKLIYTYTFYFNTVIYMYFLFQHFDRYIYILFQHFYIYIKL